jgi:hypothetical protein
MTADPGHGAEEHAGDSAGDGGDDAYHPLRRAASESAPTVAAPWVRARSSSSPHFAQSTVPGREHKPVPATSLRRAYDKDHDGAEGDPQPAEGRELVNVDLGHIAIMPRSWPLTGPPPWLTWPRDSIYL